MATSGFFNEHTGNKKDGNYYCQECGEQVSIGWKHHHASEVPALKRRVAELEALIEQQRKSASVKTVGANKDQTSRDTRAKSIRTVSDRDTLS